jgi:hypothetical protein
MILNGVKEEKIEIKERMYNFIFNEKEVIKIIKALDYYSIEPYEEYETLSREINSVTKLKVHTDEEED